MGKDNDSDSILIKKLRKNFSESEMRKFNLLSQTTSRMWRNFWIEVAHNKGYSNAEIAKTFELTESTIRYVLKKGQ